MSTVELKLGYLRSIDRVDAVDLPWRWRDGSTRVWPYVIFLLDKQMI